jgi:hypothetical protein
VYLVDSRGVSPATTAEPRWFDNLAIAKWDMLERVHQHGDKATISVANDDGTFRCIISMSALGSWSTVYRHKRRDNAIDQVGSAVAHPTWTDGPGLHWQANETLTDHFRPERQLAAAAA